jgi:hypothetical protein
MSLDEWWLRVEKVMKAKKSGRAAEVELGKLWSQRRWRDELEGVVGREVGAVR